MISKHYCPQCNSFDLLKLHRNFLHKRILGSENKLQCKACGQVLKKAAFDQNIPREVPVFLEVDNPISVSAAPTAKEAPSAKEEELLQSLVQDNHPDVTDFVVDEVVQQPGNLSHNDLYEVPEEDFKVTETILPKVEAAAVFPEKDNTLNTAPPQHSGNEQLVDEHILVKETKSFWPYVVASLLVLFGTAYAFIWMPMSINAEENETIQVDMSIGEPLQVLTEVEPPEVETSAKPELTATEANLPLAVGLEAVEQPILVEEVVKVPSVKQATATEAIPTLPVKQATAAEAIPTLPVKQATVAVATPTTAAKTINVSVEDSVQSSFQLSNEGAPIVLVDNVEPIEKLAVKLVPENTAILPQVNDEKLKPRPGSKADTALGALYVANRGQKASPIKVPKPLPVKKVVKKVMITEAPAKQADFPDLSITAPVAKQVVSSVPVAKDPLVDVPLPRTSVRQYRVVKSDLQVTQDLDNTDNKESQAGNAAAKTTPASVIVVEEKQTKQVYSKPERSKRPTTLNATKVADITAEKQRQPVKVMTASKKTAALLGISATDLTVLASTKSVKISNTNEKKAIVKPAARESAIDANTQLLEKVAVKFIQQDLDRLLPE